MGVRERYEARKKNQSVTIEDNNTTKTTGVKERFEKKKYKSNLESTINFNTLDSDLNSLATTISSAYDGWQSEETMKNTKSSIESMQNRLNAYQEYRKLNGITEEDEKVNELVSGYKSTLDGWDDLSMDYGQYKSVDAYNKAIKDNKAYAEQTEKAKTDDLNLVQSEIDKLQGILDNANNKKPKTNTLTKKGAASNEAFKQKSNEQEELDNYLKGFGYSSLDDVEKAVGEKKAYLDRARYIQEGLKLINDAKNDGNYEGWVQEGASLSYKDFGEKSVKGGGGHARPVSSIDDYRAAAVALYEHQGNETPEGYLKYAKIDKYRLMNEDEFNNFAYWRKYDAENGTNKAYEYIDSIEEDLNIREGQAISEKYKDKSALAKVMYGVEAGLDQFSTGIENAFNFTDDYIPTTSTQYASQGIRKQLYDTGFDLPKWLGGTSIGQVAYDAVNTTANMLPSIAAGTVANVLVPGAGTYVTAGLMGLSASGNAYQQMLNQGYNKTQSRTYASLVGLSEATLSAALSGMIGGKVTEKAIENIIKGIDKGFLRFAVRWGMSGASEIPEEALQGILEPLFQNIALGYEKNKFEDTDWSQIAYEGLLGGISGLGLGGVTSAVSTGVEQHTWNKAGKNVRANNTIPNVLDIVQLTPQDSDAYETYTRYANKEINAENITDTQIGRLYDEANTYAKGVLNNKKSSVGAKENATKILSELSKADEKSTVDKDTIASVERGVAYEGALHESVDALIESGLESNENTKSHKLAVELQNKIKSGKEITTQEIVKLQNANEDAMKTEIINGMSDADAKLFTSLYDGKSDVNAFADSFNLVREYARKGVDQDYILEHSGVLSPQQVGTIYTETRGEVIKERRTKAETQQKLINDIVAKHNDSPFIAGMVDDSIMNYGVNKVEGKVDWQYLTDSQQKALSLTTPFFSRLGADAEYIADGQERGFNAAYEVKNDRVLVDVYAGMDKINNPTGAHNLILSSSFHEVIHWAKDKARDLYQALDEQIFATFEKMGMSEYDVLARRRAILEARENEREANFKKNNPNGKYEKKVYSDEDVRDEVIARACEDGYKKSEVFAELTQNMTEEQRKTFIDKIREILAKLKDWIENFFAEQVSVSIESQDLQKFKDEYLEQIRIMDEMLLKARDVNQALKHEGIKTSDIVGKDIAAHEIQFNERLVEKHIGMLEKNYSEDSTLPLDTLLDRYNKVIDMWKELGGELNSKFLEDWNNKVGTDRTFSVFKAQAGYKYNVELSSMCKKGVALFEAIDTIVKEEAMKQLNTKNLGKAEKEILYDILKSKGFEIPCAICYVEQARQREGVIIDAFLNGKVEKTATGKVTQFKLGWNETLKAIQDEMKAQGFDYSFPSLDRSIATDNYSPADLTMDEETQEHFFEALKNVANKEIRRYNKDAKNKRKLITKTDAQSIKEVFKGKLPLNLMMFRTLFNEPSSRFMIGEDLLYSSMTTQNLASSHNGLYSLFNAQGGVGGYKTKQGTIIYWADILGKTWKPDTLRNEGGVRNQSNSDFLMYTLLDHAQMYIDFTAKGYYLQAYTKVLSELKLFGLSKGKINASFIPKVVVYQNADGSIDVEKTKLNAGLDENGNPIYDDFEGINHEEAFMLIEDAEYSKSIGGVCIGYSDNHISKLLDDNRIQLIIGFHDKTNDTSKRYKGAVYAENYNGRNEATKLVGGELKTVHIGFNKYIKQAEGKFKNGKESVVYNGKTYKYNDIPHLATDLYLEFCESKGYNPAYSQGGVDFSKHPNYYKLLADFSLYDINGNYAPHQKVEFNMPDQVPYLKDGKKAYMPTKDYIKQELQSELAVRDAISEQLADKSENGIIPQFIERANALNESKDTKYSDRDKAYMDAVNNGDIETAQRLVDEVAKESGYPVKAYHGTNQFGFTKFDPAMSDDKTTLFFTDDISVAKTYAGRDVRGVKNIADAKSFKYEKGKIYTEEELKAAHDFIQSHWYVYGTTKINVEKQTVTHAGTRYSAKQIMEMADRISKQGIYGVFLNTDNFLEVDVGYKGWRDIKNPEVDEWKWKINYQGEGEFNYFKAKADDVFHLELLKNGENVHDGTIEFSKMFSLLRNAIGNTRTEMAIRHATDGSGVKYDTAYSDKNGNYVNGTMTTREFAQYAKKQGYSGVVIKNMYDWGNKNTPVMAGFVVNKKGASTIYILFDSNQVKSADPITYDDKGNVIPLSERFNKGNDDIRYSDRDDFTDAEYNKLIYKKPIKVSKQDWSKINSRRTQKYAHISDEDIPMLDIIKLAEYNKINEAYNYVIRNNDKYTFNVISKIKIKPEKSQVLKERIANYESINRQNVDNENFEGVNRDGDKSFGNRGTVQKDESSIRQPSKSDVDYDFRQGDFDSRRGIKLSDRDSAGNTLTKEQIEFFKDSKIRDENGNLLVVRHGTSEDFHVFDFEKSGKNGKAEGYGFYFSDDVEITKVYGDIQKEVYLNITKPLFNTKRTVKKAELTKLVNDLIDFDKDKWGTEWKDSFISNYVNTYEFQMSRAYAVQQFVNQIWEYNDNDQDLIFEVAQADGRMYENSTMREFYDVLTKSIGYDGIIAEWSHADGKSNVYVAFNSEQSKYTSNKTPTTNQDMRFSDRDNVSVYDKIGETEKLIKENEMLKEDVEMLKERLKLEGKVTHGEYFNQNQLNAVAGHIRNIANSTFDKKNLASLIDGIYKYIAHSPDLNWQDMFAQCYDVARMVLDEAKPVTTKHEYSQFVLKQISGETIYVNEAQIKEAEYKYGKHWRNKLSKRFTITTNPNDTSIDTMWKGWSSAKDGYPNIFDADETASSKLASLIGIVETLRETTETIDEYDIEEQTRSIAYEIYNKFWTVQPIRTTADKYTKQIQRLNFEHRKAMAELREHRDAKLKEQHKIDKQKSIELYKSLRERKDKEIAEVKKLGKERLDAYKERAERNTKIQSITANALTLSKWLTKNSKEHHIHETMKGPVINLLQSIDFSSKQLLGMKGSVIEKRGTPTRTDISFSKALSQVKDMMRDASVGKEELVMLYGHGLDDDIKTLVDSVDNIMRTVGDNEFVLNKMTLDELKTLDKIVATIKHSVSAMNKFHTVNHAKGIASLSQEEIAYADKLGKEKVFDPTTMKAKVKKLLRWDNSVPYYAFKRFGEAGKKIFEAFQDGWDKLSFNAKKIIDFAKETYTNKEVIEWSKEIKTFDIREPATDMDLANPDYKPQYKKVQMTVPQIMSLYCSMKREQAKNHILQGGIRVADITMKKGQLIHDADGITLTASDINHIISELTPRQKQVADALQRFMNTICADWGNEVSMTRFGYRAFGEENYFPIESDANNVSGDDAPQENRNSLFKLLNMSFTKNTIEGANNRIVIKDIFDVFASHSSDMAKYNALALPVLDANRWYNYTEKIKTEDERFITKSVKASIENAFGKEGKNYIRTFLEDINGQQNVGRDTLGKEFFSRAKIVSVAANLRVALLQPTAFLKASAVMNNKYLTKAFLHKPKFKHAEKYCGIALWKSLGYYDTDISKGLTEKIKHDETWKDKVVEISMKGAEWGDKITFGYLWNACELEIRDTRKDLKVGSDEFFKEVGKRLRDVIYSTQVVDSTMTRSQIMRSGNMYEKMLTAFSSEPTLAYNMLQDVKIQGELEKRANGKVSKETAKKFVKVFSAYTITNVVAALIESGFDALRDDDDEEMDMAKFMEYYLTNFATDMSISGKIPYIKELVSIAQGFSSSRSDTQWMQTFSYAVKGVWKLVVKGEGNPTSTMKNIAQVMSYISGLPFYSVYRDLMATLNKLDILTTEDIEELFEDFFV